MESLDPVLMGCETGTKSNPVYDQTFYGEQGWSMWRGSSERCLKWGGGGLKGSFQKHFKTGGWVKAKLFVGGRGF